MNKNTYAKQQNKTSEYEKRFGRYLAACFLSEISKIIIFAIIFACWNRLSEFGAALLFLFLFRSCSGGLHCKSYLSCLCLSFILLLTGIWLGENVFLPQYLTLPLTAALAVCSYQLSPILSASRPPATPEITKHAKNRTLVVSLLFFISLCIFTRNQYWNIGFWLYVINTIQLFTAYIIRRWQHVSVDQNVNLVS